ncbi:hypothetical protein FNAPI_1888 [Fusarium napiforme]|uniref:Uncharacterized protein n=1 Tax=Fusarium napiforme TaxID=42672 RepID=A0A8H5K158_9HYPO|nr:hypothetical protein FNAPI_1888 [Fusarium napiforme]
MLSQGPDVSFREGWVLSRIQPMLDSENGALQRTQISDRMTSCEANVTGTYRLDESLALFNYLNKTMSVESAARAVTAGCPDIYPEDLDNPEGSSLEGARRICGVWGLLAAVLLRFEDDCDMVVDLLVAIQALPSINSSPWWVDAENRRSLCQLPYFDNVWQNCYESLRCDCHSGKDGGFTYDEKYYRRAGTVEAKMYLRGIPGITEFWAYKTINLVCAQSGDLQFVIHEIYGWLQTAGPKLAQTLDSSQIKCFERVVRGRRDKRYEISATMFEHWQHWKKSFLEVSFDEDLLSSGGRELARECHDIMKAQNIKLPLFL